MLYYLSQHILDWAHGTTWESRLSFLRLFRYITVRSAGAAVTALVLCWWLGPKIIRWLKQLKFGQDYSDKAEEAGGLAARVLSKKGTPTMGGLLIVVALVFSTMLWAQWNAQVELTLLAVLDVHTGCPWSRINQEREFMGPRDSERYPQFTSFDLQVTRPVKLPIPHERLKSRIGFSVFNLFNHFNPRDVQNDIDSARYAALFNGVGRTFRGKFILDF